MDLILAGIFILCLALHCWSDMRELLLYDWVNALLAAGGAAHAWLHASLAEGVCAALTLGLLLLALRMASGGGLGEGDVKLAAALGLWLGWQRGLLCLLLAFAGGAAAGALLLLLGRAERRTALPFGPFLCAGALAAQLYGREIIGWYLSSFM